MGRLTGLAQSTSLVVTGGVCALAEFRELSPFCAAGAVDGKRQTLKRGLPTEDEAAQAVADYFQRSDLSLRPNLVYKDGQVHESE